MSKTFLFKLVLALSFLVAAILWLLSIAQPDTIFGNFSLSWAVAIISGVWGIAFILKGLFEKNVGTFKKMNIFAGTGLMVVAFLMLINELAIDSQYVLPIIAIFVCTAFVLSILAVGGKKWDQGDNKNVGYKNYYQRKAEEEKRNKNNED